jgi:hypothetical protein
MDENPFNAGSPGAEEVDLYGKFLNNPRIYSGIYYRQNGGG